MLAGLKIDYVIADPPPVGLAVHTIDPETAYIRLHGSPVMYHSSYSEEYLQRLHSDMKRRIARRETRLVRVRQHCERSCGA